MSHCEPGCTCCTTADTGAPITVTINPEARVNVAGNPAALPQFWAGEWSTVLVGVVNEGFVTGPLAMQARPVMGVSLDLPQHALTGRDQELSFRLRFDAAGVVDLELRFYALGSLGGLADHNTLALLLRCEGGDPSRNDHGPAASLSRLISSAR